MRCRIVNQHLCIRRQFKLDCVFIAQTICPYANAITESFANASGAAWDFARER